MNDLLMVPAEKWERLQAKYRGSVNQSALLNKIGRLGATEELLLNNESIPAGMAVALAKPLAQQRTNLTKRLKTGQLGTSASYGTTEEEPEAMMDTPNVALIKRLLKKEPQTPATPSTPRLAAKRKAEILEKAREDMRKRKIKKEAAVRSMQKKQALKKAASGVLESLGFGSLGGDDGGYSPKGGQKKKKRKQTEVEKLQDGIDTFHRGSLEADYDAESPPESPSDEYALGGFYETY